ncbi:MAG: hypothetical protein Q9162_004883 [Coniocarpon cinnabarinum]
MYLCLQRSASNPATALLYTLLTLWIWISRAVAEVQENGLDIETTSPGDCSLQAQDGDVVSMHYNGTLAGGSLFDSSHKRNKPFEFKLGEGLVIEGWDVGLQGMCVGEERTLVIPPDMAYGARKVGHIPPQSTLTFETKLLAINGVTQEDQAHSQDSSQSGSDEGSHEAASGAAEDDSTDSNGDKGDTPHQPGAENGECRLLGPFALVVQAGLGILALSSLVFKRWRERPRRPLKVWFFDVSKQVVGSALLHLLNVLMSMVSSANLELATQAPKVQDQDGRTPNPCSFYLINIAVDTTLGIPILVLFLKVITSIAAHTPLARPAESIKSGNYGHPPRATWWIKQSGLYFLGLLCMKFCVLLIFTLMPQIAMLGDWALRWTEGSEALQIVFVMFVFPLIMNAVQYYIIDAFIKDSDSDAEEARLEEEEGESESREPLQRGSEYDEGGLSPRESRDVVGSKTIETVRTTKDGRDSMSSEPSLTSEADERKR